MNDEEKEALKLRFAATLAASGVVEDDDETRRRARTAALRVVGELLSTGDPGPEVRLRAFQCAFLDPRRPDFARHEALALFGRRVEADWATALPAGAAALRAMVVASISPAGSEVFDAVRLGVTPLLPPDVLASAKAAFGSSPAAFKSVTGPRQAQIKPLRIDVTKLKDAAQQLNALDTTQPPLSQGHAGPLAGALRPILVALSVSTSATEAALKQVGASIQELANRSNAEAIAVEARPSPAVQEALWYGQSRYSLARGVPLRRITHTAELLWTIARELYGYLRVEGPTRAHAAASYAVEILLAVCPAAATERRTASEWLNITRPHVSLPTRPALEPATERLLRTSATGLPAAHLLLHAGNEGEFRDRLPELGLDLEREVTGETWLEILVLQHFSVGCLNGWSDGE